MCGEQRARESGKRTSVRPLGGGGSIMLLGRAATDGRWKGSQVEGRMDLTHG